MEDREAKKAKWLRGYKVHATKAAFANAAAQREAIERGPGWGGRWVFFMEEARTAGHIARDMAESYMTGRRARGTKESAHV